MVKIVAPPHTMVIKIVGHGVSLAAPFALDDEVSITPSVPSADPNGAATGSARFADYAAVIWGSEIATFAVEVATAQGGQELVAKAWNALWTFHLLSLAAGAPCMPLFSVSEGGQPAYSLVNRSPFVPRLDEIRPLVPARLEWARAHQKQFGELVRNQQFRSAMLCYANAHYLPDLQVRIMLLWAGIEGLLSVDAELNRRLALYAALMIEGSSEDKTNYFTRVKKAYGLRSRAVHGAQLSSAKMQEGYSEASAILIELLRRCVELARVPTTEEFDRAAVAGRII
jgi:hypothetical protein